MPCMALELLLARQAGVLSREQALRAGVGAATVDRLVRTRRWRPLHPRVYLVPGYGSEDEARAWAAVVWAGEGAVLSGAAAAWWHGLLAEAPSTLGVITLARRAARPGVAVRCRPRDAADRAERRGLAVVARGLAVLEAAVEFGGPAGELLLDRAAKRIGWAELLAAHRRNPKPAAGRLLVAATGRSAGDAGAVLVRLLRASGLRGWQWHPPATAVFPAARVAVEATVPGVRERASRGLDAGEPGYECAAQRPGWRLLRFGRAELTARPAAVLATIAAAVAGRDLHHLGARIGPPTGNRR